MFGSDASGWDREMIEQAVLEDGIMDQELMERIHDLNQPEPFAPESLAPWPHQSQDNH